MIIINCGIRSSLSLDFWREIVRKNKLLCASDKIEAYKVTYYKPADTVQKENFDPQASPATEKLLLSLPSIKHLLNLIQATVLYAVWGFSFPDLAKIESLIKKMFSL